MGFHYRKEQRLFAAEWEKLAAQYRSAGFDEAGIQAMRDFDWELFCRRRAYENREQAFPREVIDGEEDESRSSLLQKFPSLTTTFDESDFSGRYDWTGEVSDPVLAAKLSKLSAEDKELLTLLAFDGYNQAETAVIQKCSQQAVSKKIQKLKKYFQKWL